MIIYVFDVVVKVDCIRKGEIAIRKKSYQSIDSDRSCQNVVSKMALNTNQSVATGGYCKARQRLSETIISGLAKAVASRSERQVQTRWRWQDRTVYLVDGTTLTILRSKSPN